jgi:hypothetical protein
MKVMSKKKNTHTQNGNRRLKKQQHGCVAAISINEEQNKREGKREREKKNENSTNLHTFFNCAFALPVI